MNSLTLEPAVFLILFHLHLILTILAGWASENVGRILRILYEACDGRNVLERKERIGGLYTAKSKQSLIHLGALCIQILVGIFS